MKLKDSGVADENDCFETVGLSGIYPPRFLNTQIAATLKSMPHMAIASLRQKGRVDERVITSILNYDSL